MAELDILTEPESSRGLYDDEAIRYRCLLARLQTMGSQYAELFAFGDILTITSHYHEHLPLPSWSLLKIQRYLQRIGLSGAAEIGNHLDYTDYDAVTTAPYIAAIAVQRHLQVVGGSSRKR